MNLYNLIFFTYILSFTSFGQSKSYVLNDYLAFYRLKERVLNLATFYKETTGKQIPLKFDAFNKIVSPKDMAMVRQRNVDFREKYSELIQELNINLKIIKPYLKKAEKIWEEKNKKVKESVSYEEGYLPDNRTKVKTKRIGVILDISGSMDKYLPFLTKHINKNFQNNIITPVLDSHLSYSNIKSEWYFLSKPLPNFKNPFKKEYYIGNIPLLNNTSVRERWLWDNFSVFKLYITGYNIDTIYWFTDLEDECEDSVVKEIEKMITSNSVRLYVQVPSRSKLPKNFLNMLRRTKGKLIVKKLK